MARTLSDIEDLKERIAHRLAEYQVTAGEGRLGTLQIAVARRVTRTFKAHWTGFKIFYDSRTIVLHAALKDGSFWTEGYISRDKPSWVLAFRKDPHPSRGTGGPRPDDKVSPEFAVETAVAQRKALVEAGVVRQEELIRMEDFDDPEEGIDQFFNYAALYVLKSVNATWADFGYHADPSAGWDEGMVKGASVPMREAIAEGLKKSDILWLKPNTSPTTVACWFVYTKQGRLFVLSGERQQIIPDAHRVRDAHVVTRWKGRDARMTEFEASARVIGPNDPEFEEVAETLINKRQSVREGTRETIERWRRECVILELFPRV